MEVEGIGPATFTQAAGFLKLADGEDPLDRTWVHPESYPAATKLLEKFGFATDVVQDKARLPELRAQLAQAYVPSLASELEIGEFTLRDIIDALGRPERDPREDLPKPIFKKGVLKLEDLTPGMELKGTVLNVVDFGAFVDIGLKDSGLVHISQLANRYVKSPHDVVSVSDVVTVWVMLVDKEGKRVSLTMVKPGTERHRGAPGGGRRGGGPGGEAPDPNRQREGRGGPPGQGRRGGPVGVRSPRPPASALTSPPVGAPSVAVLAETPSRRPDRDEIGARRAVLAPAMHPAAVVRLRLATARDTATGARTPSRVAWLLDRTGPGWRPSASSPGSRSRPRGSSPAAAQPPVPAQCPASTAVQRCTGRHRPTPDFRTAQATLGSPCRRARLAGRPRSGRWRSSGLGSRPTPPPGRFPGAGADPARAGDAVEPRVKFARIEDNAWPEPYGFSGGWWRMKSVLLTLSAKLVIPPTPTAYLDNLAHCDQWGSPTGEGMDGCLARADAARRDPHTWSNGVTITRVGRIRGEDYNSLGGPLLTLRTDRWRRRSNLQSPIRINP